jgi:hypothetical protein
MTRIIDHSMMINECHITYLLGQKGHRECLVKQPELPTLTLLVGWISEDPAIEQRPMYISDHTSYISRWIRGFAGEWELDAVEVVNGGRVEMQWIPLVEWVNFAARWNLDIGMGEDKLAEWRVEGETIDTIARGEDKVGRRAVPRCAVEFRPHPLRPREAYIV